MTGPDEPRITWWDSSMPVGLRVTQVSVWAIDEYDGRILIQDRGTQHFRRYTLPGGKPEPEDRDDPLRTAAREAFEESQIHIDAARGVYLGYQMVAWDVAGVEPFAQLRYAVPIIGYEPAVADPDSGRTYRRYMVNVDRAAEILAWGEPGARQAAAAKRAGQELGLRVDDPAPDGYRDGE